MKHLKLLTLTFLFIFLHAFSMSQYCCYRYYAPEIEKLIPFSKGELQKFKEKRIKKVEKKSIMQDERTIYYLNEEGQVTSEETFYKSKKKEFTIGKTYYKYNQNGLLTVKDANGPYLISYDSIAYDEKGRIIHYYAYQFENFYRKKYRVPYVIFNMNLNYSDENKVILFDSTNYEMTFYTFNNQNEAILKYSDYGIDSVSIDTTSETEYSKRYWYKHGEDTVFKLGLEYTFKNGLLQTETAWNKAWNGSVVWYKTYYTYNEKNWLMRTENENRYQEKKFYTYESGLILEKIIINGRSASIDKYIYTR
jgi:hypothetical protein